MILARIGLAVLVLTLAACATPPRYTPLADESGNQVTRVNSESGKPYVLSAAQSSRVAVEQADFAYQGATFNIKVISDAPNLVTFGPGDITVKQGGNARTVLGKAELETAVQAKNESAQKMQTVQEVLAATQQILGAFMPANSPYSGLAAQQIATSQQSLALSRSQTKQTDADSKALTSATGQTHLDNVTIGPGATVSGLVTVSDAQAEGPLEFTIRVGADQHVVRFNVSTQ
jgi:hypothetical protein